MGYTFVKKIISSYRITFAVVEKQGINMAVL